MSIEKIPRRVPETVRLNADSLLSKWGFGDGDDLDWLLDFISCDIHEILFELVKAELLPALQQRVEIEVIPSIHNPVRAVRVDGEDVTVWHCKSPDECPVKLLPECITVPGPVVLALARRIVGFEVPKPP